MSLSCELRAKTLNVTLVSGLEASQISTDNYFCEIDFAKSSSKLSWPRLGDEDLAEAEVEIVFVLSLPDLN